MANTEATTRRRFVHAAALAATVPAVLALPAPSMVAQAAEPDPILAAIERHRLANAQRNALVEKYGNWLDNDEFRKSNATPNWRYSRLSQQPSPGLRLSSNT
jgi:hypothetical protein